mmetsp:Transcript_31512/g.86759  ORF Transcript_31512/g.86759 Transcript_31512/m.86759 type:complete len:270 (-) Transcript_31512:227-1036(-)
MSLSRWKPKQSTLSQHSCSATLRSPSVQSLIRKSFSASCPSGWQGPPPMNSKVHPDWSPVTAPSSPTSHVPFFSSKSSLHAEHISMPSAEQAVPVAAVPSRHVQVGATITVLSSITAETLVTSTVPPTAELIEFRASELNVKGSGSALSSGARYLTAVTTVTDSVGASVMLSCTVSPVVSWRAARRFVAFATDSLMPAISSTLSVVISVKKFSAPSNCLAFSIVSGDSRLEMIVQFTWDTSDTLFATARAASHIALVIAGEKENLAFTA